MDKRQMRITWNEFNWEKPSGHFWTKENQEKSNVAYENQYGFGHEEWLFNPRYRVNGFQYGYVRGVEKASLDNEMINELYLYTKDTEGNYFFVGILKNVLRITENKAEQVLIKKTFDKYFKIAIDELKEVNSDYTELQRTGMTPTLKFKWEDANILEEPIPVIINDSKYRRYQSYKLTKELEDFSNDYFEKKIKLDFRPGKAKNKSSYTVSRKKGKREVKSLHVEILDYLYNKRLEKTNKERLSVEKSSVNGKIIDLLEKVGDSKFIFYEVKTSNSGLTNIRDAIGQILEYALIDEKIIAQMLIIIGPARLNKTEKRYLERLKQNISIEIKYWFYDTEKKELIKIGAQQQ